MPRIFNLLLLALVGCISMSGFLYPASAQYHRSQPPMRNDAELADVFFFDSDRGWAVGDRGVIWTTDDGGRHWTDQNSGVDCRLESVHFIDHEQGWVVGGWIHPFTHRTSAVVLRTVDGGEHWEEVNDMTLPALHYVRFSDQHRGLAVGNSSATYPSGVFRSDDGGRSWTALPAGQEQHWIDADILPDGTACLLDGNASCVTILGDQLSRRGILNMNAGYLRDICRSADGAIWCVGDGGLVLVSRDEGASWQSPAGLPAKATRIFDFRAVTTHGEHCWIAGEPGSGVFHSADGGRTWQLFGTSSPLPITALTFVDQHHGWAAGALGTILATRDGGETWRRQRGGGTRVALLGIFDEPQHAAPELFTKLAGDDGYLAGVEIVSQSPTDPDVGPHDAQRRTHEACVSIGATAARTMTRFPLRPAGLRMSTEAVLRDWNRLNEDAALPSLERQIVRRIRQWRPDVIVTTDTDRDGNRAMAHVIRQIVLSAAEKAGDPTAYADQIDIGLLTPWSAKKIFSISDEPDGTTFSLATSQLATNLGISLAESAARFYGLVGRNYRDSPSNIGINALFSSVRSPAAETGIFAGITLAHGADTRRQRGHAASVRWSELARRAQRRRNLQQLFSRADAAGTASGALLSQIETRPKKRGVDFQPAASLKDTSWKDTDRLEAYVMLTKDLDPDSAAQLLFQRAHKYAAAGQWGYATEAFQSLTERFPQHELSESSWIWRLQHVGSAEVAWLRFQAHEPVIGKAEAATPATISGPGNAVTHAKFEKPLSTTNDTATAFLEVLQSESRRLTELEKKLRESWPGLYAEPEVRFPLITGLRNQQLTREAEQQYRAIASVQAQGSWSACAGAEIWLKQRRGTAPKPVLHCRRTEDKPRLDGKLNDSCWLGADSTRIRSAGFDDLDWPATAAILRDETFLYVAATCQKAGGCAYPTGHGPRPRDPDLSQHDRIELLIDVDRDYATYYRIAVDSRGWPAEDCVGNQRWNPKMFVAADMDEETWSVEMAIPLDEFSPLPAEAQQAWAIGIQRVVPHVGFQAWTQPAAISPPRADGFGLLLFD